MLIRRNVEACARVDWDLVAGDFIAENFMGLDAGDRSDPDTWTLTFNALTAYRDSWLNSARTLTDNTGNLREALLDATVLQQVAVTGDSAVAYKVVDGWVASGDGSQHHLSGRSLHLCRKVHSRWRIQGLVVNLSDSKPDMTPVSEGIQYLVQQWQA